MTTDSIKETVETFEVEQNAPLWSPNESARKSFFDDFLQVQTKIENPKRDASNPHYGSSYISLEGLLAYVRPILIEQNFILVQSFFSDNPPSVSTYLYHKDGAILSSSIEMKDITSPQQVVSYSTYMRRVQLSALLGIRDEDDDDGNGASVRGAGGQPPWMQPQVQVAAPPPVVAAAPALTATTQAAMPTAPQVPPFAGGLVNAATPPAMPQAPQPTAPPAPPTPAPAAAPPPPPAGALSGEMLAEAQNMMNAVRQTWGDGQAAEIMQKVGLPDISHMMPENYAPFVEQLMVFVQGMGKSMVQLGPEGGNQVLIQ